MTATPATESNRSAPAEERRRSGAASGESTPRRRISDSALNRLRWPVFIAAWLVAGLALLAYLLSIAFFD